MRLNAHFRELLQQYAQALTTTEALAQIEASISASRVAARESLRH